MPVVVKRFGQLEFWNSKRKRNPVLRCLMRFSLSLKKRGSKTENDLNVSNLSLQLVGQTRKITLISFWGESLLEKYRGLKGHPNITRNSLKAFATCMSSNRWPPTVRTAIPRCINCLMSHFFFARSSVQNAFSNIFLIFIRFKISGFWN